MEAAFAWLGQLMTTLGSFFPAWKHVECTDVAVLIKRGNRVRELKPGIYFYWPFWSSIYTLARKRQTKSLPSQSLITKDGQRVVVGGMVRYTVTNAIQALVETHDVETAVIDESLAVLCQYVTRKRLEDIQLDRSKVNNDITRKIGSALKAYGVEAAKAQLTDFAPSIVLNHVGNFPQSYGEE